MEEIEEIEERESAAALTDPPEPKPAPPRSVLWFAHAETVLPLVIKLGLFNESAPSPLGGGEFLKATGFPSRMRRLEVKDPPVRNLFRASHIIPFSGNIAFLLFYCPVEGGECTSSLL